MAEPVKKLRVIKNLDRETVNRALAEWVLVKSGVDISARCRVATAFKFDHDRNEFESCRVEIEVL